MAKEKQYYSSVQELENNPIAKAITEQEFSTDLSEENKIEEGSTTRRDFLKFLGFSTAAATIASCETPVHKAIPYVVKPDEIIPGIANWYASSYYDGHDYASLLVKTREGRPISVKANGEATYGQGLSARVMGSVLSLYDSSRLRHPLKGGKEATWESVDAKLKAELRNIDPAKQFVFLTDSIISPSLQNIIDRFKTTYPNFKHINYDAVSYSAMLEANQMSFGKRVLPTYKFDKAEVIVSFAADFLNDWTENTHGKDYAKGRNPESGAMSKHYQFESNLSLTGSNADYRFAIKPSEQGLMLVNLYNLIAQKAGQIKLSSKQSRKDEQLNTVAKALWRARGKSLVVAGENDVNIQLIVNAINSLLQNYGSTIDTENVSYLKQGNDKAVNTLLADMKAGKVDALMMHNVNPSYTLAQAKDFDAALSKVRLSISFALREDETASKCGYVLPNHHYLESWGDLQPTKDFISIQQPTISPLFKTRHVAESLLTLLGESTDAYSNLKTYWESNLLNGANFNQILHDGFLNTTAPTTDTDVAVEAESEAVADEVVETSEPSKDLAQSAKALISAFDKAGSDLELTLYTKTAIGNGQHVANPWLQETPDPLTKATWDNYLTVSIADA
ncbi:MAG: TAT-variant-translocated molybdopterin oxidoreductase, partial [Flavobacteriales bacterium]